MRPTSPAVFTDADDGISADTDFDRLPGLTRLDPADIGEWRDAVLAREGG